MTAACASVTQSMREHVGTHQPPHASGRPGKGCGHMHDVTGSAGMLRGWIAVWTMQMLWLFASLTIAMGVLALVEALVFE
jgi:hypothetical protein